MPSLLSSTIQPPLLTLLSSTSQPALSPLFISHTDPSCPQSSIITQIPDDLSRPRPIKRKWDAEPDERSFVPQHPPKRGDLADTVIHIQGSKTGRTYIQAGSPLNELRGSEESKVLPLGVESPWVHFQLKRLGARSLAVEIGVIDLRGRKGIIRCSSFQKTPSIHPYRQIPLIHLPLALPNQTSSTMTQWLDISLNMTTLLPLFQSLPRSPQEAGSKKKKETEMPNGQFGSISYVRVYASCRVRRIWFSEAGEVTMRNVASREFALLAAAPP